MTGLAFPRARLLAGAALAVAALAVAGFTWLASAAPASAAGRSPTTSTAYNCGDYQPGDLCTCDGGHNTADCDALKRSRVCADSDGLVILCCQGSSCTCRVGGARGGEMCPTGSYSVKSRVPPGADHGLARPSGPRATETGGASSPSRSRRFNSGHSIAQMNGRKVGQVEEDEDEPGRTSGAALDPEACSCWDGIGSCTVKANRCTPHGGDLGCTGTCATKDPGARNPAYIEQENLYRRARRAAPPTAGESPAPSPPEKPGYIWVDGHWERARAK